MKNISVVFVLALLFTLFSFNVNRASAANCAPGELYSTSTGQPCNSVNTTIGCQSGFLFSPVTGQPCGTSTATTPPITICPIKVYPSFGIGSRGENVRAFQQSLFDTGYLSGKVDGVYGPITDLARDNYFRKCPITITPVSPNAPVISGVSGPQSLNVNQQGTWTVRVSSPTGGNLLYSVLWGDETFGAPMTIAERSLPAEQSATFTHSYSRPGIYTPVFTVTSQNTINCITTPCPSNGGSSSTSLTVHVGNVNNIPSLTVVSPNGGEAWAKGTTQTIRWKDNAANSCATNPAICLPAPRFYDIKLQPTCAGDFCTAIYRPSYTIATGVNGSSYNWSVGNNIEKLVVPEGAYLIQVCKTGTDKCDSSDKYFTITSGTTSKNNPPRITSSTFNHDTSSPLVGQPITFTWKATDADNDDLLWGVNWSDGTGVAADCSILPNPQNKQNWTFITSHAWANPGTYKVTAYVSDCKGGSDEHTFNIAVGSGTNTAPKISSILPASGAVGSTVTVYGSGFVVSRSKCPRGSYCPAVSSGVNTVHIGGTATEGYSSDGTSLTFAVPSLTPAIYPVSVANSSGKSNSLSFGVIGNNQVFPPGCTSDKGFSTTTGEACSS